MEVFRYKNIDDFTIRDMRLSSTNNIMLEITKKITDEKEEIIKKEILRIIKINFVDFEPFDNFTSKDLIEFLESKEIILEMEEPEVNVIEQSELNNNDYSFKWVMSNPKVKLYKRLPDETKI